jgi:hypothetical protein
MRRTKLNLTLCDQKMTARSARAMTANTAHNQSEAPWVRRIGDADGFVWVDEARKEDIIVTVS